MNEPHIGVLFVYLALLICVLIIPAFLTALIAHSRNDQHWSLWGKSLTALVTLFALWMILGFPNANAGDKQIYQALALIVAGSTVSMLWLLSRKRLQNPPPGVPALALTALAAQVGSALLLVMLSASCWG